MPLLQCTCSNALSQLSLTWARKECCFLHHAEHREEIIKLHCSCSSSSPPGFWPVNGGEFLFATSDGRCFSTSASAANIAMMRRCQEIKWKVTVTARQEAMTVIPMGTVGGLARKRQRCLGSRKRGATVPKMDSSCLGLTRSASAAQTCRCYGDQLSHRSQWCMAVMQDWQIASAPLELRGWRRSVRHLDSTAGLPLAATHSHETQPIMRKRGRGGPVCVLLTASGGVPA